MSFLSRFLHGTKLNFTSTKTTNFVKFRSILNLFYCKFECFSSLLEIDFKSPHDKCHFQEIFIFIWNLSPLRYKEKILESSMALEKFSLYGKFNSSGSYLSKIAFYCSQAVITFLFDVILNDWKLDNCERYLNSIFDVGLLKWRWLIENTWPVSMGCSRNLFYLHPILTLNYILFFCTSKAV